MDYHERKDADDVLRRYREALVREQELEAEVERLRAACRIAQNVELEQRQRAEQAEARLAEAWEEKDELRLKLASAGARLAKVERERNEWRHAAEKGAALCRSVTDDNMDDYEWDDSAKNLYDEVISLAAKAKIAAAQPEEESRG